MRVMLMLLLASLLVARPGVVGAQESTPQTCADGLDNDGDAAFDCCDSSCFGVGACAAALCTTPPCDQDGDGDSNETGLGDCNPCACDLNDDTVDDCAPLDSDGDGLCDNGDVETCDALDNDGDAQVDEGFDADGDGVTSCGPDGVTGTSDDDCNDSNGINFPGNAEICDGFDNDCSGSADDGLADGDSDGFTACDVDGNGRVDDCDDANAAVNQAATEVCDGLDTNCNGAVDDGLPDGDGDGFVVCDLDGNGVVDDCDDVVPQTNQAAFEACDGYDNDCDGLSNFSGPGGGESDADGDGYIPCTQFLDTDGGGGIQGGGDCVDTAAGVNPAATELCDGYDTDCTGGPSFVDANGDEEDADDDGYIECQLLSTEVAPGVLGDGECDDGDASSYPGAVELCDFEDQDNDCDGVSDLLEVFTPAELAGLLDTDFDGTPDCQDADADDDGYSRPTDCNDLDPAVRPDQPEVCEVGEQVDSDCDGDVDAASSGAPLTGNVLSRFVDFDRDGFGSGLMILFCEEPDAEPCATGVGICYAFVAGDCDDANANRNPDAAEICNGIDEDCDGESDDIGDDLENPLAPAGCRNMKRDLDGDGVGDDAHGLCLCLVGEATEAVYGGDSYVLPGGDCDDEDSNTHPAFSSGSGSAEPAAIERQDGNDNDCDGFLFAIELDCDDDGSLAKVPRPGATPLTATNLRLAACEPDTTRELSCWDDTTLELSCDPEALLWVLRYGESEDGYGGRFDGGARRYPNAPACSQVGDCDDHCTLRCADQPEVCDGIDNDCNGIDDRDFADSLPDSMLTAVRLAGIIEIAEGDLDRDGYIDCESFDGGSSFEFTYSDAACDQAITDVALLTDCNPACTFINPVSTEQCNGFTDVCGGELEGTDGDNDRHRTCGAWSDPAAGDAEGAELWFTVVWVAGAGFTEEQPHPPMIPLIPPRTRICDGEGGCEEGSEVVVGCDLLLSDALAWLLDPAFTFDDYTPPPQDSADLLTALGAALEAGEASATELVHAICTQPFAEIGQVDQRPARAKAGSCALLQLSMTSASDVDLDATLLDAVRRLPTEDLFGVGVTPFERGVSCLDTPEQSATRTVWTRDRLVDVRRSVSEAECIRLYDGVTSCADVRPVTELAEDWATMQDASSAVADAGSLMWTQEIGHYTPTALTQGTVMTCWGDLTQSNSFSERVGGDCGDGTNRANRDLPEGPWDVRALYDLTVDGTELVCDQCVDGIDNNCDGQTDCEDPSCAPCFVGVGGGCYASSSPCAPGSCGGDLASRRSEEPGALLMGLALTAALCRRRRR